MSGWIRWLRQVLGTSRTGCGTGSKTRLCGWETEELLGEIAPDTDVADAPLAVQLATALAQVAGLEQINGLLNERLGLADAQNIELNRRLEEAHATLDRAMLALPAPSDDAGPTRWGWQFWRR